MHGAPLELDRIIRLPEILRLTGLSRPTLYRLIRKGKFPAPVQLAENCKGWFASGVKAWQDSLKSAAVTPDSAKEGERLARTGDRSPRIGGNEDDAER